MQLEGKADDKDAKKKPKSKKDGEEEIQVGEEEAAEAEEEEKGLYDYVPEMQAEDEAVLLKLVEASAQRKQQLAAAGIVEGDDTLLLRGGGVRAPSLIASLTPAQKRKTGPTLSKEELAARREEQAAIRAAKRDERRAEKWRKNGYASLSLEEEADGGAGSPGASPKASPSLPSAATAEDDIISGACHADARVLVSPVQQRRTCQRLTRVLTSSTSAVTSHSRNRLLRTPRSPSSSCSTKSHIGV